MAQPNILLICVDHWGARLFGREHPAVLTPTINQLAENGVRFTNAYSTTPTCIPARRALMTGTRACTHGDRVFNETLRMPEVPTLPAVLADAGYQCYAVGKMHVYPQRDRIGFHDVILNEEGRHHLGMRADDYELFLAQEGHAGAELAHGMCTNDYMTRPWHLPEYLHTTNWTAREMCRMIDRRDPTRPAFWYLSFNHPHPPMAPLRDYWDLYEDVEIPMPVWGDWTADFDAMPWALKMRADKWRPGAMTETEIRHARRAFYALITHIDHQIRLVIGLLREQELLDDTIIGFTCDHGDMLGDHGLFAKAVMYEEAAKVPLILIPTAAYAELGHHRTDDRLAALRDVMPTLLEMAGVPVPETVEGRSLLGEERRELLYAEHYEDARATRMVRDERFKLIYYPVGNRLQLFDLQEDPDELHDLSGDAQYGDVVGELSRGMIAHLWGEDEKWVEDGRLVGEPDRPYEPEPNRGLSGQRGWRFMG